MAIQLSLLWFLSTYGSRNASARAFAQWPFAAYGLRDQVRTTRSNIRTDPYGRMYYYHFFLKTIKLIDPKGKESSVEFWTNREAGTVQL